MTKQASVGGFSLIELVVVIAIVSVLAALALERVLNTHDNAHEVAVSSAGGGLAAAVIMVRSQWIANGDTKALDGVEGYGSGDIAVSSDGWPTDASRGSESSHRPLMASAQRCKRLWEGLLATNSPKVAVGEGTDASYMVAIDGGNCRYNYRETNSGAYIIYNARNGDVITTQAR